MSVTKEFIWMEAFGIILLGAAYFWDISVWVFIVYNILLFILLFLDYFLSPGSKVFELERVGEEKLSLYAEENIQIKIRNNSSRSIQVLLKDEIPFFHFETSGEMMKVVIPPHKSVYTGYKVIPKKRGSFIFGCIHMRYPGKWNLCTKQYVMNLEKEYKVYPNVKDLRKYRMMVQKNHFQAVGRKSVKTLGMGTEFESLREYVTGDEYRKINWMATAREKKLIVNQFQPEKNQQVFILIDSGRPMSYSIRGYKKLDLSINTALLLADIVNQNGDNAGLMVFNTDIQTVVMPGKGNAHRNQLMEVLYHIEDTKDTSSYEEAFYYLRTKQKRRSLVCIFTDFDTLEEAQQMMVSLTTIRKKHLPIVILIKNEKLEKTAQMSPNTTGEIFDKGVAIELQEERKKIIRALNSKGIMCMECPPEQLALNVINQYLEIKNRMAL